MSISDNKNVPEGTPFSIQFVMDTTLRHMNRSISISTSKSINRMSEFDGDADKGTEIVRTVRALNALEGILKDFRNNNPSIFPDK